MTPDNPNGQGGRGGRGGQGIRGLAPRRVPPVTPAALRPPRCVRAPARERSLMWTSTPRSAPPRSVRAPSQGRAQEGAPAPRGGAEAPAPAARSSAAPTAAAPVTAAPSPVWARAAVLGRGSPGFHGETRPKTREHAPNQAPGQDQDGIGSGSGSGTGTGTGTSRPVRALRHTAPPPRRAPRVQDPDPRPPFWGVIHRFGASHTRIPRHDTPQNGRMCPKTGVTPDRTAGQLAARRFFSAATS